MLRGSQAPVARFRVTQQRVSCAARIHETRTITARTERTVVLLLFVAIKHLMVTLGTQRSQINMIPFPETIDLATCSTSDNRRKAGRATTRAENY